MKTDDSIVAISSSVGIAARIIVRISGIDADETASHVIVGDLPQPGFAATVRLQISPRLILPAIVYRFQSPRSVTGENLIEFHLPGNALIARRLIEALMHHGARQAEAGEFTARGFFNGRIDLAQAEGVAAIISARSAGELNAARQLLAGELTLRLAAPIERLARCLALIEAYIDFSDESPRDVSIDATRVAIDAVVAALTTLLKSAPRLERLSRVPHIVLAGRPNAGKSTLLNVLAGRERSVVSPVAGTTRDAIGVDIRLRRGIVRVFDVAGIENIPDKSEQSIEYQMQLAAVRSIESADLLVALHDVTDTQPSIALPRDPNTFAFTKCDLVDLPRDNRLHLSAKTGEGIEQLCDALDKICFDTIEQSAALALTARHARAIAEAISSLDRARNVLSAGSELVALELRDALDHLGSISGTISPDDILGKIFATFCIGK